MYIAKMHFLHLSVLSGKAIVLGLPMFPDIHSMYFYAQCYGCANTKNQGDVPLCFPF